MNKMGESSSLLEFIDLDELQSIQDSFAKTVGISSVIFSPEGEPLTRFSYPTGFCSLIQSTEEGKRRCFQSVTEMSRKAIKLKKPAILYCFAHGGHFVAPIFINDEHKGTMFAGQFIPQSFSPKQLKALEKTAVEINLDPQLLTKEAKEMCVIEEDVVEYYSSLLFQIVKFIGRQGAKAAELNRAQDALQKARDELETRVQERTAELVKSNKQLKREIAERKRAEEALLQSEIKYRTLVEHIPAITYIAALDESSTTLYVSPQIETILGISPADYKADPDFWVKHLHPDDRERVMDEIRRCHESDQPFILEYRMVSKDGRFVWLSDDAVIVKDDKGKPLHLHGVMYDITERKRAEEERKQLLKELEAKNTELERFTYTVSHDLRSPLITVQGFVEMLREDFERNEKEKVESDLKYIENGTAKMEHLLDDTLRLSRIGRMVNPPEDVSFGKIVQEALEQTAQQIKSSGVEISVAEDSPIVHVDRMRIAEVLENLITNSINYRGEQPSPKIDIGYRIDGEETVFFVQDNGIGIDKSQHEKVFELFYQVEKSSKGTGAGLAIVKRIIEVHGGRIWIESEEGKGCSVCFTLPVA